MLSVVRCANNSDAFRSRIASSSPLLAVLQAGFLRRVIPRTPSRPFAEHTRESTARSVRARYDGRFHGDAI
ncbi:hypothetical protein RSAG8_03721, partial [Rhizoctonia solani AG-8 WAC10335]